MSINSINPEYTPLDHKRRTIRLLDIEPGHFDSALHCRLRHVDLSTEPEYVAVSYTWGPMCTATELLFLDGQPCYIRPSLYSMLKSLNTHTCDSRHKTFWIDAFCIDQSNINERNHQVRLMGDIYRQAHHVIVWLGDESDESDAAFGFMHDCHTILINDGWPKEPSYDTYNAIDLLCHRDYWFRAWIKQEIILAARVIVRCGQEAIGWETFALCCLTFMADALVSSPVHELIGERQLRDSQKRRPLKGLLQKFAASQASDSRDRVFALLGLASDCGIAADYALTPAELLEKVLLHCQCDSDTEFSAMMQNMLVPDSSYQDRLVDVELLLQKYENLQDNVQLRLNARLLRNLAAVYTTMSDPSQYLKIKTCIVWAIIAVECPEEPKQFEALFRGWKGIDQAPWTEINRSIAIQAVVDMHRFSGGALNGSHKLYNTIIHICQRAVVDPQASSHADRDRRVQLFWELISQSPVEQLMDLGDKLDQILELRETRRLGLASSLLSNTRNREYHSEALRVLGYTTGCGCITQPDTTEKPTVMICCPLERFGMYWIIFGVLWAHTPVDFPFYILHEYLLESCSLLYVTESRCATNAWLQLRPILDSPVPDCPRDWFRYYSRLCEWWEMLQDSCKGHCRPVLRAIDAENVSRAAYHPDSWAAQPIYRKTPCSIRNSAVSPDWELPERIPPWIAAH